MRVNGHAKLPRRQSLAALLKYREEKQCWNNVSANPFPITQKDKERNAKKENVM